MLMAYGYTKMIATPFSLEKAKKQLNPQNALYSHGHSS